MNDQPAQPAQMLSYADSRSRLGVIRARRKPRAWTNWIGIPGWAILAAILLGGSGFLLGAAGLGALMPFQIVLFTISLALIFQAIRNSRRRRASDVLVYVEQAVRLNLPLPTMLYSAQQSESKATARKLDRLRLLLENGASLGYALAQSTPQLPARTLRLIDAAEKLGQLPTSLARLTRPKITARPAALEREAFYLTYPPTILFLLMGTTSIWTIFVIPRFEQIFRDFRIHLPASTKTLLAIYRDDTLQPILGIAALIWLGQVFAGCLASTDRTFVGHLLDGIYWRIPILHSRIRDRGMADLCDIVARATEQSWPLEQALEQAAEIQSNAVLRGRIMRWVAGIRAGQSISAAASAAQMPQLLVSMLAPVRNNEDLSRVMEFLANHYQSKFNRLEILLKAAYVPFIVAIMGLAVGFVCLAIFEPLIDLIKITSNYTGLR